MRTVLLRLLREDARRYAVLSGSLVAWFTLIMLVVRNAAGTISAKTALAGSSVMRGFGIGDLASADALIAQITGVSFNHPIVLALVGAVSVGPGVRACQGELQRGTLELTLAAPLARWRYLLAYCMHAVFGITLLMVVAWASMTGLDRVLDVPGTLQLGRSALACLHAGLVFCSFAALALAVSVWTARRGSAMFITMAILVVMFALTFAERAWDTPWLAVAGWGSVFHGFDAGATLLGVHLGLGDVAVPIGVTILATAAAFWRFGRRDL